MSPPSTTRPELPVMLFEDQQAWTDWLAARHADAPGVWLQIAKKASGLRSVSYAEALDVALCYGWIDGQRRTYDAAWFLQKFTPRGPKSLWSQINRAGGAPDRRGPHAACWSARRRKRQTGWPVGRSVCTRPHDGRSRGSGGCTRRPSRCGGLLCHAEPHQPLRRAMAH
jgi:hypothetical protein